MRNNKVFAIKLAHSVVFIFMVLCLLYILYAAVARRYDWILLIALAAVFTEGIVLLLNGWRCPMTTLAEKHGAASGAVTDIFLPAWLTRHTFKVGTALFALELVLLALGYFSVI